MISGTEVTDSDGEPETVAGYRSAFDGPTPATKAFDSPHAEAQFMVSVVQGWLDGGVAAGSIGVLVRVNTHQERASGAAGRRRRGGRAEH